MQASWNVDMKTLKCMYGLKSSLNAMHSCIYCMQVQKKRVVTTLKQVEELLKKHGHSWKGGLFCSHICHAPIEDGRNLKRWRPVLPIPLDKVYICTSHAINRMVEKLVHLHF